MDSQDSIKKLATLADSRMQNATYVCRRLSYRGVAELDTDLSDVELAITALTTLRDAVGSKRNETKSKITDVLSTPNGQRLVAARKKMAGLSDRIYDFTPNSSWSGIKQYDVHVSIPALEENPEDTTTVCVIDIGHFENYGDDFGHTGGRTIITVKLPDGDWSWEDLGIQVEGDEIEDKAFLDKLMKEIQEVEHGSRDTNEIKGIKGPVVVQQFFEDSKNEIEVNGVKIVLAINSGNYYLNLPNVNWAKLGERMQVNYNGISLAPNWAGTLFQKAQDLAREGKTAEDIYFIISQLAR